MIRRFNYTNRTRIRREDIVITLREQNGDNWFDADLIKLANYELPSESLVFLEAYRLTNWMRFSYGHIGKLTPPKNLHLKLFDSPEGVKFRLKVTAAGDVHKLLAEADAISLLTQDQAEGIKEPLLPVMPSKELGDEIYRVDFSEGHPVLLINSEVGNYKDVGRSAAFISLAIPAVLREILTQIIIVDERIDDEDMDDWHSRWIRFIKQLPGIGELPRMDDNEECSDWIQNAVAVFAKKQKLRAQFKEFWRDEL